jgi:multidrug efflux system outer membrane protein
VPNPQSAYQALASASWEIDLWGRIRRLSESAQATLFATEQARRCVVLSLVSTVASSYLQLRALDDQIEISRRTLAAYAESVRLFELQFRYGVINQMTVEQARSQYEAAAAQIPQLESQAVQLENALSILLGRNPGPIQRGKPLVELALPAVPAGLPSDMLERRPDIAQAEQLLIAANARIGAARAQYFPSISLTGTFGGASAELSNLFSGPARVWSFAGALAGPIFTGGAVAGTVAQAEAAQKAAILGYELAIQSAFADVENALVSRAKTDEQLQAQERLVKSLSEYERLARLQYVGGYTPYLTVLNAQQQLFPAELSYAQIRAQNLNALVGLYKSMGGGWIVEAERVASQAAGTLRP